MTIFLLILSVFVLVIAVWVLQKGWKILFTVCLGLATVCVLSGVTILLSNQEWFKGFFKNEVISVLRTTTEQYGTKLNEFHNTVEVIQKQLKSQQENLSKTQEGFSIAQQRIEEQQKKLENIELLVKNIFERTKNEVFSYTEDKDRMVILEYNEQHATICFKLSEVPILQTIRLQYHVFAQPTDAYDIHNAILIVNWGADIKQIEKERFYVTYIPDPTKAGVTSDVTIKDQMIYIDGRPVSILYGKKPAKSFS